MLSHVVYKNVDPYFPASLSARNGPETPSGRTGFPRAGHFRRPSHGRHPAAVTRWTSPVIQAVNAGVDVLLVTDNYGEAGHGQSGGSRGLRPRVPPIGGRRLPEGDGHQGKIRNISQGQSPCADPTGCGRSDSSRQPGESPLTLPSPTRGEGGIENRFRSNRFKWFPTRHGGRKSRKNQALVPAVKPKMTGSLQFASTR